MKGWRIYNHCWMPTCADRGTPDLSSIKTGEIWKEGGLLAQWISDFDCEEETGWWHVIKSEPFEITSLKSSYRRQARKGAEYFRVEELQPGEFEEESRLILEAARDTYNIPKRPNGVHSRRTEAKDESATIRHRFGAFDRESGKLCAVSGVIEDVIGKCIGYSSHKALPSEERRYVNAALVSGVLDYYKGKLSCGWYLDDGARSVLHETNFQIYLIKYFGFRKAYCKMHLVVNPKIRFAVGLLFRLRALVRLLKKLSNAYLLKQIDGVMTMMEVSEERKYGWRLSE